MVKIIDGAKLADKIKDRIAREIYEFNGPRPNLAVVLVGDREDSKLYVSLKERVGKVVGVDTHIYKLAGDSSEKEILEVLDFLNKDVLIDAILVQLPLPSKFDADKIIAAIDSQKDADGFHPRHPEYVVSPVLASVLACLESIKFSAVGKTACVLYNSEIFGLSIKEALEKLGLQIVPKSQSVVADLLITALGEPQKIKKDMIKEGATIIDIGITKKGDQILGDVDFEDIKDRAGFITPVPGGIGPMTIAFLFKNVLEIYKRNREIKKTA
ncbi:TPA: bifunctional methylenetetrahydrofolate dehydrogenase/methenyltetrahydrofolate cyclohydrolase [Candidatus Falkowbacteria bacterium]|nr:bifunctional methylenetetrahydrofolate dehydrogenase/methenyltetrahydrofolate cyclohydrolase [Candidatus Falkowbacteria bacterium]